MSISIPAVNNSPQSSPRHHVESQLLYIGLDEKETRFACGTDTGFLICKCNPFTEEAVKNFNDGGIGVVEITDKEEHIVALIGGGSRPAFPLNKLVFYNYETKTLKGEMLCRQNILNVKKRGKYLAVVAEDNIYLYDEKREIIKTYKTCTNSLGLIAFVANKSNKSSILVFPSEQKGHVTIVNVSDGFSETMIQAHAANIRAISLNKSGSLLATASETGTLVRLWNTADGKKVNEFRRGATASIVYSVAISCDDLFIACISGNGTLHIFATRDLKPVGEQASSAWGGIGRFLGYYTGMQEQKSFRMFKGIDGPSICTFASKDNNVVQVLTAKGLLLQVTFDFSKEEEPVIIENKFFS